jgi:hypothetical protein
MKNTQKIIIVAASITGAYFLGKQLIKLSFNPKNKKILFIGDSHTVGTSWPNYMAKKYDFKEINLAKGAITTGTMFNILENYLKTNSCDAVFIYGGANDAYNTSIKMETTVSNIQKMVDLARSKNIIPFVFLGYNPLKVSYDKVSPTKYVTTQAGMNELVKRYRELQKKIMFIQRARIIPIWNEASYSDTDGDALHLKTSAKIRLADYIGKKAFGLFR